MTTVREVGDLREDPANTNLQIDMPPEAPVLVYRIEDLSPEEQARYQPNRPTRADIRAAIEAGTSVGAFAAQYGLPIKRAQRIMTGWRQSWGSVRRLGVEVETEVQDMNQESRAEAVITQPEPPQPQPQPPPPPATTGGQSDLARVKATLQAHPSANVDAIAKKAGIPLTRLYELLRRHGYAGIVALREALGLTALIGALPDGTPHQPAAGDRLEQLKALMREHPEWGAGEYLEGLGIRKAQFWRWTKASGISIPALRQELGLPQVRGTRKHGRQAGAVAAPPSVDTSSSPEPSAAMPAATALPASADVPPSMTEPAIMRCRECGCTDDHACSGGCYWVEPGLCSRCAGAPGHGLLQLDAEMDEPGYSPALAESTEALVAGSICSTCIHQVVCVIPDLLTHWVEALEAPELGGRLDAIGLEFDVVLRRCQAYRPDGGEAA